MSKPNQLFVRHSSDDFYAHKTGAAVVKAGWRLVTITIGPLGDLTRPHPENQLWYQVWFEVPADVPADKVDAVISAALDGQ